MHAELTTGRLLDQGILRLTGRAEAPRLDAELLLAHALKISRARLKSHPEELQTVAQADHYAALLDRRAAGEPVAYIVGYKEFWSLRLAVTPAVLVPRPETELLVERALDLRPMASGRIVDLGTGSGAIALALASERPQWMVFATDASASALEVARLNATALGLTRVHFREGSWFEPLAGERFDVILSNPPYVAGDDPVLAQAPLCFEPQTALTPRGRVNDDGPGQPSRSVDPRSAGRAQESRLGEHEREGRAHHSLPADPALSDLRAIIRGAPLHLERGGWLLLEHGATQAADVASELVVRGFCHVRSHRDLAGHERMTEAQWAE